MPGVPSADRLEARALAPDTEALDSFTALLCISSAADGQAVKLTSHLPVHTSGAPIALLDTDRHTSARLPQIAAHRLADERPAALLSFASPLGGAPLPPGAVRLTGRTVEVAARQRGITGQAAENNAAAMSLMAYWLWPQDR